MTSFQLIQHDPELVEASFNHILIMRPHWSYIGHSKHWHKWQKERVEYHSWCTFKDLYTQHLPPCRYFTPFKADERNNYCEKTYRQENFFYVYWARFTAWNMETTSPIVQEQQSANSKVSFSQIMAKTWKESSRQNLQVTLRKACEQVSRNTSCADARPICTLERSNLHSLSSTPYNKWRSPTYFSLGTWNQPFYYIFYSY